MYNDNLLIIVDKSEKEIITEILNEFSNSKLSDLSDDSFGLDSMVGILVPVIALLQPIASKLIDKLLVSDYVTIKYNGYELSGSYKNVQKMIKDIQNERNDNE